MSHINQISVFVANKTGSLSRVTDMLARAGVDIRAFYIADTTDFGILRMIVDKPDKAYKTLTEAGISVSKTPVVAVKMNDSAGAMNNVLKALAENNIDVEYAYAFISRSKGNAYFILRADDIDKVETILASSGIETPGEEEMYSI